MPNAAGMREVSPEAVHRNIDADPPADLDEVDRLVIAYTKASRNNNHYVFGLGRMV